MFCIFLQKTFVIQDCVYSDTTTYSSTVTKNIALPSNFSISFIINTKGNVSNSSGYLNLTNNTTQYIGKTGSTDTQINLYADGDHKLPKNSFNTDIEYVYTCNNGVQTLTDGTNTVTVNKTNPTVLSSVVASSNTQIKNLKIKAL